MSGGQQFKAAVTSASGVDQGWRGGLEGSLATGGMRRGTSNVEHEPSRCH